VRVSGLDTVEIAIAGVVGLQTALISNTRLNQPHIGESTSPPELEPLPEKEMITATVVHCAGGFDFEFGFSCAVVGALKLAADSKCDTEAVPLREVEYRGEGDESRLGRPLSQCGAN
jgi:hypothetical protein